MNTTHFFLFVLFCGISSAQYVVLQEWSDANCNDTSGAKIRDYWVYPADGSCFDGVLSGFLLQGLFRVNYTDTQINFFRFEDSECKIVYNMIAFPRDTCNGLAQVAQIYDELPQGQWYLEQPTGSEWGYGPWETVMIVDYYNSDSCDEAKAWSGTFIMGFDQCNYGLRFYCVGGEILHYDMCSSLNGCSDCEPWFIMDNQCYNDTMDYSFPFIPNQEPSTSIQMRCENIAYEIDSSSNKNAISLALMLALLFIIV